MVGLSVMIAVVGYFLRDQHERSYILTSIFILLCVSITLCLVFVPKVLEVAKDPHSNAKPQRVVISAVGSKPAPTPSSQELDKKLVTRDKQQILSKINQLTRQNDMLRLNATKVCSS